NAVNFRTAVVALLNAATLNGSVYSALFSMLTGKYSFAVLGPGLGSSFTMPAATGSGLQEQFGLVAGTTTALPFTSPNIVRFETQTALQVHTNLVSNGDSDVLQAVYASENASFSSIAYSATDVDARSKPLNTKSLGAARFYITDEDANMMDFNGLNVTLTIMVYLPLESVLREYVRVRMIESMDNPLDELPIVLKRLMQILTPKPVVRQPRPPLRVNTAPQPADEKSDEKESAPPPPPPPLTALPATQPQQPASK
ncbi:MAG: hypothetical protein NT176_09045, partial [Proteobacteria bacterium]|nr:hypothetical protein [Pseudomonadota bacterium]